MWAWRSFLRRPNPLITSRLRPAVQRHNGTQTTTVLDKNLIASLGHSSDDATGREDSHADAPVSATSRSNPNLLGPDQDRLLGSTAATKRHLYLVLDDHRDNEYGIYKLDLDADPDPDPDSARPLPQPAAIRLEVPRPPENPQYYYPQTKFAALGSCIVTTAAGWAEHPPPGQLTEGDALTFVYDTRTAALSTVCDLPEAMGDGYQVAVAVGNRLYVLTPDGGAGGLQCMTTDRADDDGKPWQWRPFSGSSRCFWGREFFHADPPFRGFEARAHAVHPQGRAFFVSFVDKWSEDDDGTFTYDTVSNDWTRIGGWWLPFRGHAGYDRELDAWVGLHADHHHHHDDDEEEARRVDGYLCACRVPSSDRPPEWKVGREKMLHEDQGWSRVDVKLVHMGERGEYCLVERLRPRREGADEKECLRDGGECLLRLTTFRVRYDDDGELIVDTARRRALSYTVSRYHQHFEAQAFWI